MLIGCTDESPYCWGRSGGAFQLAYIVSYRDPLLEARRVDYAAILLLICSFLLIFLMNQFSKLESYGSSEAYMTLECGCGFLFKTRLYNYIQ